MAKFTLLFLVIFVLLSCKEKPELSPLDIALSSSNPKIKRVMDNLDAHELQIKFTRIERGEDGVKFVDYDFQVDANNYFYPASSAKFLTAVAALEKLNGMNEITLNTAFSIDGSDELTSFKKDIQAIFAVSDNDANNRLIEFVGFDALNQTFIEKGITTRISHRLSADDAANVTTKPLTFYFAKDLNKRIKPTTGKEAEPLQLNRLKKGKGYFADGDQINAPFDFSMKNYFPIASQSEALKRVIFPEAFEAKSHFNLSGSQRDFLLEAMSSLPKDVGYDPAEYYDSYVKFFIFGDNRAPIPEYVKIYNKVGYAYGTLTDNAYIKDSKNNIEFMLCASILVNDNGIFNDDNYEYDEVGIPFLAELGREIYKLELKGKQP